ncbi:hypothetical protein Ancab_035462, partial [Ancistrocladus abbreviatus]
MQGGDKSSSGTHTPHNIVRITETMPKEQDHENGQGRIRVLRSYTGDEGKDNTGDSSKVKKSSREAAKRDTLRGANVGDCSTSRDRIAETSESCIPVGTHIDIVREDSFLPGSGVEKEKVDDGAQLVFWLLFFDVLYRVELVFVRRCCPLLLILKSGFWCFGGCSGFMLPCVEGLGSCDSFIGFTCSTV